MGAMTYKTGIYVKGDQVRVADTAKDAVAAAFDGFVLQDESPAADVQPDATATPDEVPEPAPATPDVAKPKPPKAKDSDTSTTF